MYLFVDFQNCLQHSGVLLETLHSKGEQGGALGDLYSTVSISHSLDIATVAHTIATLRNDGWLATTFLPMDSVYLPTNYLTDVSVEPRKQYWHYNHPCCLRTYNYALTQRNILTAAFDALPLAVPDLADDDTSGRCFRVACLPRVVVAEISCAIPLPNQFVFIGHSC